MIFSVGRKKICCANESLSILETFDWGKIFLYRFVCAVCCCCWFFVVISSLYFLFEKSKSLWKNRVERCSFCVYVHNGSAHTAKLVRQKAWLYVLYSFILLLFFLCCSLFAVHFSTNERYFCRCCHCLSTIFRLLKLYTIASPHITFLTIIFKPTPLKHFKWIVQCVDVAVVRVAGAGGGWCVFFSSRCFALRKCKGTKRQTQSVVKQKIHLHYCLHIETSTRFDCDSRVMW